MSGGDDTTEDPSEHSTGSESTRAGDAGPGDGNPSRIVVTDDTPSEPAAAADASSDDGLGADPTDDAVVADPGVPSPGDASGATPPPPPPPPADDTSADDASMQLPHTTAQAPPSVAGAAYAPTRGAETWYRTDEDRYRSVRRLANPWYRRLARGVIGLSFLAAVGIGLYFGARLIQDYLDRDRLPAAGPEVPAVRSSTFEIRSTAPAPVLDGTLSVDSASGAFEFTGRGTGTQAGIQVVSPDGATMYTRRGSTAWTPAGAADQVANDVRRAVAYLRDDDTADAILTSQLRRGYVDLIERTEVGEGEAEQRRYELRLDTANFRADFPIQYQEFQDRAIPGVDAVRGLLVTITLDEDEVLVAVDDEGTNWSWQRLSYSEQPFQPLDPTGDPLDQPIEITDGNL